MSDKLDKTIVDYWDERAGSYSVGVLGEFEAGSMDPWFEFFSNHIDRPGLRALDLGCGPGAFSILLAKLGCTVDAVDASANMLAHARDNVEEAGVAGSVTFHQGDVAALPFDDASFDLIALRNVTWLLRDPKAAYAEWRRVLVNGGTLLVFDANWYRYLDDPALDEQRKTDQVDSSVLGWDQDALATKSQEDRCERIAEQLPMTHHTRPAYDLALLQELGFASCRADEDVWQRLWTPGEQSFYGSSPLFLIEAVR